MGTHIGNPRELKQPLNGTILSVFAVKHREHHIDPLPNHAISLKSEKPLPPNRRNGTAAVIWIVNPLSTGQFGVIPAAKDHPVSVLGNSNRKHVVFFRVHMIQHGLRRPQRHLMLGTSAAEQNTYAEFFHRSSPHFLR